MRKPTRGQYLLDLVLTDMPTLMQVEVVSELTDHCPVSIRFFSPPLSFEEIVREVWHFNNADWRSMRRAIRAQDWSWILASDVDAAAAQITDILMRFLRLFVPSSLLTNRAFHP